MYIIIICRNVFYNWNITLNYGFIVKIGSFNLKILRAQVWFITFFCLMIAILDAVFCIYVVTSIGRKWYFEWNLVAPPLNWETASHTEIRKQWITQYNLLKKTWTCYIIAFIDSVWFWVSLITHDKGNFYS